jgi:hypothetical protein
MERSLESRLIREHVAAIHAAVETQLYAIYGNFGVCELVQVNFTLYGQMVTIDALKPIQFAFNYKRDAWKYYIKML